MRNRILSLIAVLLLIVSSTMPIFATETANEDVLVSEESQDYVKAPVKPYEQVIAQNGPWYVEQIPVEASKELAIGYNGSYAVDGEILFSYEPTTIKIKDDMSLTGLFIPYSNTVAGTLTVTLRDDKGNVYGPFPMEGMPAVAVSVEEGHDLSLGSAMTGQMMYSLTPSQNVVLPKGNYNITLSEPSWQVRTQQTGPEGAYLLKGIYAPAYDQYLADMKTRNGQKPKDEEQLGNPFEEDSYGVAEKPPTPKAAFFTLEADSTVDEVIINTINGGAGALPGTIAILSESGEVLYSNQAYGVTLEDVANGMWAIAPEVVLPAGTYQIGLSDPGAITYDKRGEPMFYINVSEPKVYRYDYTGTYKIDLETFKRTTLMGPVNSTKSSFSQKDFELTILDHGDYLELVGKYENMPFSQRADIMDITDESVTAIFQFSADLSGLPVKTKIGADVQLLLSKKGEEAAQIYLTGTGTYERAASKAKGADYNTYEILANGIMVRETLAPYVAAALGAATAAGKVPGPDSPVQAATGLLFPPLVGVVVYLVQEAIKQAAEKKKLVEGPKKYSKEWYRRQHPGASDETLAWIMLGDAMGNTDEPDADPEAGSSDDSSSSEEGGSSEEDGSAEENNVEDDSSDNEGYSDSEEETSSQTEETVTDDQPKTLTDRDFMSEEEKAELDAKVAADNAAADQSETEKGNQKNVETEKKPWDDLPETKTLQTGIDNKMTTYELDKETGEYVNPLTGGVLDMDRYETVVKPNLEKDQNFIDTQRAKTAAGDTAQDKALAQMLKDQQKKSDDQKLQDYKQKIMGKYGAKSEAEVDMILTAKAETEKARADKWNTIGNIAAVGEVSATVVGATADAAVDFMGDRLGTAGKVIRAGYKVTKAVASDVATSGSESNWNTVKGALIKGGADATSDFIDSKTIKGALTIGAETVGSYVQADSGNEWDSIAEGFTGGVVKVGSGLLTDKLAGDGLGDNISLSSPIKGHIQVTTVSGSKFITTTMKTQDARNLAMDKINSQIKQSATKIGSSLADSFGVDPYITDPTATFGKSLPQK